MPVLAFWKSRLSSKWSVTNTNSTQKTRKGKDNADAANVVNVALRHTMKHSYTRMYSYYILSKILSIHGTTRYHQYSLLSYALYVVTGGTTIVMRILISCECRTCKTACLQSATGTHAGVSVVIADVLGEFNKSTADSTGR